MQVYDNEQTRLEYIQELKRRFEDEKRTLESELVGSLLLALRPTRLHLLLLVAPPTDATNQGPPT